MRVQKASGLLGRIGSVGKQALRRMSMPDPAAVLVIPPGAPACNVCGFVARGENPRLCPRCGTNQRQRSFKRLFLEHLQTEVFGDGPLEEGLLLSPGDVERALLFPQLRRHIVSSLYQTYCEVGPFIPADVRDLAPFGDQSFDYVQACNVLDYVPEMEQALRAIHRVLRPGGVLVLLIPQENLLAGQKPLTVSVRDWVTGDYWPNPAAVPLVRVGRRTLASLLQRTGFEQGQIVLVDSLSRAKCTWWLCRRR